MSTKIIFIRNQQTKDTTNSNVPLSEVGLLAALNLADSPVLKNADIIFSSSEVEAIQTVRPLAEKLNLKINQNKNLNEIRNGDKIINEAKFEQEKIKQLEDLHYPAFNGETALDALRRFSDEIKHITNENQNKTIIVASHGTILNLYFAQLQNNFNEIVDRYIKTNFGAIGIVVDGKIIQDIVKISESYPNVEKFLADLGLVITYSTKYKIVFKFIADQDLVASNEEFTKVQENPSSTDEDFERVWEDKHKYEKLFFPKLKPLLEKLNQFYDNRDTDYKYQIFLNTPTLEVLNLGPLSLAFEYFKKDISYTESIYKELKDFDIFLEN